MIEMTIGFFERNREQIPSRKCLDQILDSVEAASMATVVPEGTQGEEDASELVFPKEFEDADTKTLLISEVHILLEHRKQQNESQEEEQEFSEVFMKTLNYTQRFVKFKNMENIAAIRSLLTNKKIHKFEMAALANLCPESPEEAKALIPSLECRFDDQELATLLDDLQTKRNPTRSFNLSISPPMLKVNHTIFVLYCPSFGASVVVTHVPMEFSNVLL
eukprot:snap_masked-scaffold10_size831480-processed-gene-7.0 protein:Tk01840 transcript:snap_masked-scaffold10_size831480-processed-gene-7.0-mRNA-1 annotation:"dna-directed rna polymerase ii subunit rpb4"